MPNLLPTIRESNPAEKPVAIDPRTHPILSRHWGPVAPAWLPLGNVVERIVARQRPEDAAA